LDDLFDGPGNDLVYGGLGSDTFNAANDPGGDDLYSSGGGFDLISYFFRTGGGVTVDLPLGRASGGGAGNDRLVGPWDDIGGSFFADTLIGNGGPNQIVGGEGDDHIESRGGDDFLVGEGGTDFLDGGTGNDFCEDGETVLNCEP
jgi:Ca2+-binding RTX toxin-like protein